MTYAVIAFILFTCRFRFQLYDAGPSDRPINLKRPLRNARYSLIYLSRNVTCPPAFRIEKAHTDANIITNDVANFILTIVSAHVVSGNGWRV